ncbi:MBL fold metallo-hydrolase [Histomonas meleagridis]|nr:MBL fold metallo-hydrolase [Histomonas meleagridis]
MNESDKFLIPNYKGQIHNVRQGYKFEIGERFVEVYEFQGHTPGSIGLLDSKEHYLFTGDAIGSGEVWMHITTLPLESILSVTKFIHQLREEITRIYVGHLLSPVGLDYVDKVENIVNKIVKGEEYESEKYDPPFPVECEPYFVREDGVSVIFNPRKIHYI